MENLLCGSSAANIYHVRLFTDPCRSRTNHHSSVCRSVALQVLFYSIAIHNSSNFDKHVFCFDFACFFFCLCLYLFVFLPLLVTLAVSLSLLLLAYSPYFIFVTFCLTLKKDGRACLPKY